MKIFTGRLVLRPWEDGDAEALFPLARDPDVGPRCGWRPHESVEESLETIRGVLSEPEIYAITDRSTGALLGSLGLHPMSGRGEDERELGYWLGKPFWGRGYVPEAAEAALDHAFADLGCTAVWCSHFDGNDPSRRVIEKCGFTRLPENDREHSYSDGKVHLCRAYRMMAEDWRARHG